MYHTLVSSARIVRHNARIVAQLRELARLKDQNRILAAKIEKELEFARRIAAWKKDNK